MIISEKILSFIDFNEEKFLCFTHRTLTKDIAVKIVNEGFEFAESLQSTTDYLVKDPVVLKYHYNLRKNYGRFNVIICIAHSLYDKYLKLINTTPCLKNTTVEEIITEKKPTFNEERDQIMFLLPKQYIKGFYNEETHEIVRNTNFNPFYDSMIYHDNIQRLINEYSRT